MFKMQENGTLSTSLISSTSPPPAPYCIERNGMNAEKLGAIVNVVKLSLLLMCVFSALLQIYVIVTAIKYIRKRIGDRNLHLFLLNMTVADLLLTGWTYPNEWLLYFLDHGSVPNFYKYSTHVTAWIALSVSALSLVLLNVDKLVYFLFRLQHLNILTQFRAVLLIIVTWLLSIIFVGLTFLSGTFECLNRQQSFAYTEQAINLTDFQIVADYTKVARKDDIIAVTVKSSNSFEITYKDCYVIIFSPHFAHGKKLYTLFVIVVGIVPVVSSLIVALYIESMVRRHHKNISEVNVAEEGLVANSSLQRRNQTLLYRLRTFYFVFVSTIFTFLTLIPYRVFLLYKFAQDDNWKMDCWQYFLALIIMHVQYLNAILNPAFTVTVLPHYRFGRYRKGHSLQKRQPVSF